jgi:anaerobic selenocysteine-containing dehydrogenase
MSGFSKDEENQVDGRTFHEPIFNTESGKATAHTVQTHSHEQENQNQLRLMTIRSEGQFNTVVYEEEDIYRGQHRRDIIMMNINDAERLSIEQNKLVEVRGESGSLQVYVRFVDISEGNCAMYFPEANVLLSHNVDDESHTPLFKGELIEIIL